MDKINKTDTLRTILSGNRFTVNYYQREFRWGRKQIEQLIDDLTYTFMEFYDPKNHTDPAEVEKYGYYYMGCTIRTGGNNREIIDGQQRLTSLTLLLIYLNNLLQQKRIPVDNVASMIYSDKFGVKNFNIDVEDRKACFNRLFNSDINFEPENESSRNMLERYKDIDELFPEDLKGNALLFFTYWLIEKVLLLEIEAPTEKEAFTIFVTMNDRGLSLNSAEMMKGFILQSITAIYRKDINSIWQKEIARIKEASESFRNGEVNTEDVDFIAMWLRGKYAETMREAKKGAKDEDYELLGDRFHEWVHDNTEQKMGLKNSDDFRKFIEIEMKMIASVYLRIKKYSRSFTPQYEDVYYNANRDLNYQGMLILSSIDRSDSPEAIDRKIRIIARFVDIYASRRLFNNKKVNFNTNKYYIFRVMKLIRNVNAIDLAIILTHELNVMESKLEGIDSFRLNQFTSRYMLHSLARITSHINSRMGNPANFENYVDRQGKNTFDIEHILPDDYETYADNFNDEDDFANFRSCFGNLILLTKDRNRSVQDMPYTEKVQRYLADNVLAQSLNSQAYLNNPSFRPLAVEYGFKAHDSLFGKEEIKERQDVYTAIAKDIWNPESIKTLAGGWNAEQEAKVVKPGQDIIIDTEGEVIINPNASEWIIPCNTYNYDIAGAFSELKFIEWIQFASLKAGDIVYIYISQPVCQIKYKCIVTEANLDWTQRTHNDRNYYKSDKLIEQTKNKKFMRIILLRVFDDGVLTFNQLKVAGNKSNFQGAMHVTDTIGDEIRKTENTLI